MSYEKLSKDRLERDIVSVLGVFYHEDRFLIEQDVGERCMTARIFAYLRCLIVGALDYAGLHIDTEYNRILKDASPKCIINGKLGIPDIVIHNRGDCSANICAMEFKKEKNEKRKDYKKSKEKDYEKLRKLTEYSEDSFSYGYRYGIHIVIGKNRVSFTWFQNGEKVEETHLYDIHNWNRLE